MQLGEYMSRPSEYVGKVFGSVKVLRSLRPAGKFKTQCMVCGRRLDRYKSAIKRSVEGVCTCDDVVKHRDKLSKSKSRIDSVKIGDIHGIYTIVSEKKYRVQNSNACFDVRCGECGSVTTRFFYHIAKDLERCTCIHNKRLPNERFKQLHYPGYNDIFNSWLITPWRKTKELDQRCRKWLHNYRASMRSLAPSRYWKWNLL